MADILERTSVDPWRYHARHSQGPSERESARSLQLCAVVLARSDARKTWGGHPPAKSIVRHSFCHRCRSSHSKVLHVAHKSITASLFRPPKSKHIRFFFSCFRFNFWWEAETTAMRLTSKRFSAGSVVYEQKPQVSIRWPCAFAIARTGTTVSRRCLLSPLEVTRSP